MEGEEMEVDLHEGSKLFPGARCARESSLSYSGLGTSREAGREVTGSEKSPGTSLTSLKQRGLKAPSPCLTSVPLTLWALDFFGGRKQ